jgi:hypothetical protein
MGTHESRNLKSFTLILVRGCVCGAYVNGSCNIRRTPFHVSVRERALVIYRLLHECETNAHLLTKFGFDNLIECMGSISVTLKAKLQTKSGGCLTGS